MNGEIVFRLDDFDRLSEEASDLKKNLTRSEETALRAQLELRHSLDEVRDLRAEITDLRSALRAEHEEMERKDELLRKLAKENSALEAELALARDPNAAKGIFQVALEALEKNGMLLRHKDVYTQQAEEWRFIRPFVVAGDSEIIAALADGDLQQALALARTKTPAGSEPKHPSKSQEAE